MNNGKMVDRYIELAEKDPVKAFKLLEIIDMLGQLSDSRLEMVLSTVKGFKNVGEAM